jgi:hypothetical protein
MIDLPSEAPTTFTSQQKVAWNKFVELLLDLTAADKKYDSIAYSENGKIISTDIARHLDANYAKKPPKGATRDITVGDDLAWRYAHNRLEREISSRGSRKTLRFMAGGWAAGKTYAVRHEPTTPPDLVWDGTLREFDWAVDMIDFALTHKWKVEVAYVYRDIELAFYGAIQRAREEGRSVPLEKLPASHRDTQQTVLKLFDIYRFEKSVSFLNIHNLGTAEVPIKPLIIDRKVLASNGPLHYLSTHERYYRQTSTHLDTCAI